MQINPYQNFRKQKAFLVCVDSDGCVMDGMTIKHEQCFGPAFVELYGLGAFREDALALWNRINLFSMTRGINRFKALVLALTACKTQGIAVASFEDLKIWTETSLILSNTALQEAIKKTGSPELQTALAWSNAVNARSCTLDPQAIVPFTGAASALEKLHEFADIAVVSSANQDAVDREWNLHGCAAHVDILLAQNAGSKAECIRNLLTFGYDASGVVMIGDAPGDQDAADNNGVWFYPILVGREIDSWKKAPDEVHQLFTAESASQIQKSLKEEFLNNFETKA